MNLPSHLQPVSEGAAAHPVRSGGPASSFRSAARGKAAADVSVGGEVSEARGPGAFFETFSGPAHDEQGGLPPQPDAAVPSRLGPAGKGCGRSRDMNEREWRSDLPARSSGKAPK